MINDLADKLRVILPNVTLGEWRERHGENGTIYAVLTLKPVAYYVPARDRPLIALAPQTAEAYLAALDEIDRLRAELAAREWQPIATAPKDGQWILARHADVTHGGWQHWPGRLFVVKHGGYTRPGGCDLGWHLFPGFSVGDESLSHWQPLPLPPALGS